MGRAHILYVYEDGIREGLSKDSPSARMTTAVGEAILKVALAPIYSLTSHGKKRVRSHPVLNHGNCVNHVADLHSTDEQIFIWASNCLRTLDELSDKEIEGAKKLFDALYARRVGRSA